MVNTLWLMLKRQRKQEKDAHFSVWRHVTVEFILYSSFYSYSLCLLHSSVSNAKQGVDVILGNMSRTRHKGKREGRGKEEREKDNKRERKRARDVKGERHKRRSWGQERNEIKTGRWRGTEMWHKRHKGWDKWKWKTQESKSSIEWETVKEERTREKEEVHTSLGHLIRPICLSTRRSLSLSSCSLPVWPSLPEGWGGTNTLLHHHTPHFLMTKKKKAIKMCFLSLMFTRCQDH